MKNKRKILLAILFVCSSILIGDNKLELSAHPGRTNGEGCHTCRTNCGKWGLNYGEYHCHGGSSSGGGGSSSDQNQEAIRAQQEEQARKQAAEAEKQRLARLEEEEKQRLARLEEEKKQRQAKRDAEKALGNSHGSQFKKENPDSEMEQLTGKSEDYIEGYKSGFQSADEKLIAYSKVSADDNAKKDARTLETYQEAIPADVKKTLYLSEYKTKYKEYEKSFYEEVRLEAYHNAQLDVFDKLDVVDRSSSIEKKGRETYKKAYEEYVKKFNDEISEKQIDVEDEGYSDGNDLKEPSNQSYVVYEKFKVYNDFDAIYHARYDTGRVHKTLMIVGGVIFVLVLGLGLLYYKRRKKLYMSFNSIGGEENKNHMNEDIQEDSICESYEDNIQEEAVSLVMPIDVDEENNHMNEDIQDNSICESYEDNIQEEAVSLVMPIDVDEENNHMNEDIQDNSICESYEGNTQEDVSLVTPIDVDEENNHMNEDIQEDFICETYEGNTQEDVSLVMPIDVDEENNHMNEDIQEDSICESYEDNIHEEVSLVMPIDVDEENNHMNEDIQSNSICESYEDSIQEEARVVTPNVSAIVPLKKKCNKRYLKQGTLVSHSTYGEGKIIRVDHPYFVVKFHTKEAKFEFPDVFEKGFMSFINRNEAK